MLKQITGGELPDPEPTKERWVRVSFLGEILSLRFLFLLFFLGGVRKTDWLGGRGVNTDDPLQLCFIPLSMQWIVRDLSWKIATRTRLGEKGIPTRSKDATRIFFH